MQFYTVNQISNKRQWTPEGYLLALESPICRIGSQTYAHGEIPVESNDSGLIFVDRPDYEVFRPETIASFNGKPIVDDHPPDKVDPDNWNDRAMGVVLNPRRGDGVQLDSDYMYADLLFTNRDAINAVINGKRELSAGYEAEYEQLAPGKGRQHNIIGNHVAIVDRGRCGPQCSVGDRSMGNRGTVLGFKRRMRTAMRTNDEAGMLNVVAELAKDPDMMGEVLSGDDLSEAMPPDNNRDIDGHHVTINVHGAGSAGGGKDAVDPPTGSPVKPAPAGGGGQPSPSAGGEQPPPWAAQLMQRVDAIEQVLAALAEGDDDQTSPNGNGTDPNSMGSDGEGGYGPADNRDPDNRFNEDRRARTGDARTVTQDSSGMRTSFVHMLSQAEILMPGIQLATFDAAAKPTTTSGAMCSFKRKTLTASYGTDKGKAAIDAVLGASKPKSFHDASFSCDSVNLTFNAAATLVGQQNSGMAHQPRFGNSGQLNGFSKGAPSIGDINKRNNDFYKGMTQRT